MPNLSTRQIAVMRNMVNRMLTDTCVLQTVSIPSDYAGGWREQWTAVGTFPCRVEPGNPSQPGVIAGRSASIARFKLTVAATTSIAVNQQVIHGGFTYVIRELMDDQTPLVYREAYIERIDG